MTVHFTTPAAFARRPFLWLDMASQARAAIVMAPNFAYDLCARRVTESERAGLDLSSWRVAVNGAEPVRDDSLRRFVESFRSCGFRSAAFFPAYGLAEATVFVSGSLRAESHVTITAEASALEEHRVVPTSATDGSRRLVSCGRGWGDQDLLIVDPTAQTRRSDEEIGEIWIRGRSVAAGYWNRPIESSATFGARLTTGEGPFLRTGDLGFLANGELYVTGRLKDLVIIRGRNFYPSDIEQAAESAHPSVRPGCTAAFATEWRGEEVIVVISEVDATTTPDVVIRAIGEAISETLEIAAHTIALVKANTLPKTTSGKIQRRACRERYLSGDFDDIALAMHRLEDSRVGNDANEAAVPPITKSLEGATHEARVALIEDLVLSEAAAVLRLKPDSIDNSVAWTSLGMDSLKGNELRDRLERAIGVGLSVTLWLQHETVTAVAAHVLSAWSCARVSSSASQTGDDVEETEL
jgi:acyl-CoA synthetase (AMP-forming)/AMP-acid ligase II